jgi:hypothetical protein
VGFSQLFHLFLLAISAQLIASLFAIGLTVILTSVVFVVFGRCILNAGKTVTERGKLPSAISSFNTVVDCIGDNLVVLEVKLRSYYAHWHIALFLTTWRVHELESLIQGLRLRIVCFASFALH